MNLVNVLFTVTDKKNRLVLDLTKDDFRVFEDNETADPSASSAARPICRCASASCIDTSNSIRDRLRFEQEAAIDFLSATLRPDKDLAFVVAFDVAPQLVQDYTDDTEKLSEAIRELRAGGGTGLYDAIYFAGEGKDAVLPAARALPAPRDDHRQRRSG